MKISGFTFIRNAIRYDYPVEESIRSILPLCDEVMVAVGNSNDGTRELVASIDPGRIRIIDTVWDESLRKDGKVLAAETNKALAAVSPDTDWAFYIQADEVVHEAYLEQIRQSMERWKEDAEVEGFLFNYLHFWGSYDWIGNSRKWYRREVRIIRPGIGITSYKDAQGFRRDRYKVRVKPLDAWIYHYGWVKPPVAQQSKQKAFHKYWHDEDWIHRHVSDSAEFDYSDISSLARFTGTHPVVMNPRIARQNWTFEPKPKSIPLNLRHQFLDRLESLTGWRIGEYRNYRVEG
ncbi:MAG: glycosyltransferase family 2 protein [Bacteroidetes bacterium]|nr:MAG: glycosyltransferase family 2 protein [Bacteroidota bacterium]